jgi:hypothetical protein
MADLLDDDDAIEQEGRVREPWTDSGLAVLLRETEDIIADHLSRGDAREAEIMRSLDGVPLSVIYEAADGPASSRGAARGGSGGEPQRGLRRAQRLPVSLKRHRLLRVGSRG